MWLSAAGSSGSVGSGRRQLANFKFHSSKRRVAKLLHEKRFAAEAGCIPLGVNFLPRARGIVRLRYILQPRLPARRCASHVSKFSRTT